MYETTHLLKAHRKAMREIKRQSRTLARARARQERAFERRLAELKERLLPKPRPRGERSGWGTLFSFLMYVIP